MPHNADDANGGCSILVTSHAAQRAAITAPGKTEKRGFSSRGSLEWQLRMLQQDSKNHTP